jgi:SpoVK/Ycf46/Vps4 family AAA+-type ATPase
MATADQVKALIKSHASGDDDRFYAVALQLAAREARSGHASYAQELKQLIDTARSQRRVRELPVPVTTPRGDLALLLSVVYPDERLADMALAPNVRRQLDQVVLEQRQSEQLGAHGFHPLRRLLLVGHPGTGKTMSARALAGELRLPLFTVRLDGLITKFMGETAAKLRLVFDAFADTRGVYLFDEVDALAGARNQGNDVGEIRRVLNSFLQFLEQDRSDSVIVATSNLPDALDRALFRRFDLMIEYPMPTAEVARSVIANRLAGLDVQLAWKRITPATKGLSHAELTLAAERAAKDAILTGQSTVTTELLLTALRERRSGSVSGS